MFYQVTERTNVLNGLGFIMLEVWPPNGSLVLYFKAKESVSLAEENLFQMQENINVTYSETLV